MSACVEASSLEQPAKSTLQPNLIKSNKVIAAGIDSYEAVACYSPSADLGRDLERILKRCLSEHMQRIAEPESMVSMETEQAGAGCIESIDPDGGSEWVIVPADLETSGEDYDVNRSKEHNTADVNENVENILDSSPMLGEEIHTDKLTKDNTQTTDDKEKMEKIKGHRPKKCSKVVKKGKKIQGKNKKYKAACSDMVGFDYSLFPWRTPDHEKNTADMEAELNKFEEQCSSASNEPCGSSVESPDQCVSQIEDNYDVYKSYEEILDLEESAFYDYLYTCSCMCDIHTYIEISLTKTEYKLMDRFCGKTKGKQERLRAHKKKWHTVNARIRFKTKDFKVVINQEHGTTSFVHHRIAKHMTVAVATQRYHYGAPSMRDIDKRWNLAWGSAAKPNNVHRSAGVVNPPKGSSSSARIPPKKKPTPVHAMNAFNADHALGEELVNILLNLQDRDLTPEDYDILLQLDERVKPKTVPKSVIGSLKENEAPWNIIGDTCVICMEEYATGQFIKHLPCGHYFHKDCVVQWLSNATTCPLDGSAIS